MKLSGYLGTKAVLGEKYNKYLALKEKLIKDGIPSNIAEYRASAILTPGKLEKIKLMAKKSGGNEGYVLAFFFKEQKDIDTVAEFFKIIENGKESQVGDATLLIELLKLLKEVSDKEK